MENLRTLTTEELIVIQELLHREVMRVRLGRESYFTSEEENQLVSSLNETIREHLNQ